MGDRRWKQLSEEGWSALSLPAQEGASQNTVQALKLAKEERQGMTGWVSLSYDRGTRRVEGGAEESTAGGEP